MSRGERQGPQRSQQIRRASGDYTVTQRRLGRVVELTITDNSGLRDAVTYEVPSEPLRPYNEPLPA